MIELYDNFLPDWLHQTALMMIESDSTLWQCTKILNDDQNTEKNIFAFVCM